MNKTISFHSREELGLTVLRKMLTSVIIVKIARLVYKMNHLQALLLGQQDLNSQMNKIWEVNYKYIKIAKAKMEKFIKGLTLGLLSQIETV